MSTPVLSRGRMTEASIAAVREAASIEIVVGDVVTLRPAGGGNLKGCCPFHDEKTPSFNVNTSKNMWYCFGCSEGGDVVKFVEKTESMSFPEAVDWLADRFGIEVTRDSESVPVPGPQVSAARLYAVNAKAAAVFAAALASGEALPARQYLAERGFTREHADRFGLGYSPMAGIAAVLRNAGFSEEEMIEAGLLRATDGRTYEAFRGRLMFPIKDTSGRIIGFGARKLTESDGGPKYLNTAETRIYKKSSVLYGLDTARKAIAASKRAVIVEGYTDVMACHVSGIESAVATCGTAFGAEHVRVLRRLLGDTDHTGEITFCFDGDAAGQKAALRSFELTPEITSRTTVAVADNGMDPCEVRLAHGVGGVRCLVDSRVPLSEFVLKSVIGRYPLDTPESRSRALSAAAEVLGKITDPTMLADYVTLVARWTGTSTAAVTQALPTQSRQALPSPTPPRPNAADPALAAERELAKFMVQQGYAALDIDQRLIPAALISNAAYRQIVEEKTTGQSPTDQILYAALVTEPLKGKPTQEWLTRVIGVLHARRLDEEYQQQATRIAEQAASLTPEQLDTEYARLRDLNHQRQAARRG